MGLNSERNLAGEVSVGALDLLDSSIPVDIERFVEILRLSLENAALSPVTSPTKTKKL